jgi:hypothetical protein
MTMWRLPVPWLGSTMIGKWLRRCTAGTMLRSREARVIGKRAHTALAEDHIVIALAHNVLGRHQEFFQGGRHSALQQHRFWGTAGAFEQGIIMHVARADLNNVGVFFDQFERLVVDSFGDDPQTEALADFG